MVSALVTRQHCLFVEILPHTSETGATVNPFFFLASRTKLSTCSTWGNLDKKEQTLVKTVGSDFSTSIHFPSPVDSIFLSYLSARSWPACSFARERAESQVTSVREWSGPDRTVDQHKINTEGLMSTTFWHCLAKSWLRIDFTTWPTMRKQPVLASFPGGQWCQGAIERSDVMFVMVVPHTPCF